MSEKNPKCPIFWDIRTRNLECPNPIKLPPSDMTRVPIGQPCVAPPASTKPPHCGCPPSVEEYLQCSLPSTIETRIHRLPLQCRKPPCNFIIPAIPCAETRRCRPIPPDPLCFDWMVDEPGPNDSYGLNGLNWYDWRMEQYSQDIVPNLGQSYKPSHPGFSKKPPPPGTKIYMCKLPLECYSADPTPCKPTPFKQDVNYFRDYRCCESKPRPPWNPPCVTWATNQHL